MPNHDFNLARHAHNLRNPPLPPLPFQALCLPGASSHPRPESRVATGWPAHPLAPNPEVLPTRHVCSPDRQDWLRSDHARLELDRIRNRLAHAFSECLPDAAHLAPPGPSDAFARRKDLKFGRGAGVPSLSSLAAHFLLFILTSLPDLRTRFLTWRASSGNKLALHMCFIRSP